MDSTINDFVDYISSLNDKYSFDDLELKKQLNVLKEKHNNKNCNLGLIGESAAGKSTFINSLLGEELLVSDNLLDTTVINTIITYDEKKRIIIKKQDGEELIFTENLKEVIKSNTSDINKINEINTITIYHPALFFKNGINIVDTPGICSVNDNLNETTKTAINDLLDTIIILTPSIQVFSQSLRDFISVYAQENLDNCIFVVTKSDRLKMKEIERTKLYCTSLLKKNWNVENDRLLFYSSYIDENKYSEETCNFLKEESNKTRKYISDYIKKQKEIIKNKKELFILERTSVLLSKTLTEMLDNYRKKHELLEASIMPDFNDFIQKKKESLDEYIIKEIQKTKELCEKHGDEFYLKVTNIYLPKIDSSGSPEALKENCKGYDEDLRNASVEYQKSVQSSLVTVEKAYKDSITTFQNEFLEIYRKLPLIEYDMSEEYSNTCLSVKNVYKETSDNINKSVYQVNNKTFISDVISSPGFMGGLATLATSVNPIVGIAVGLAGFLYDSIVGDIKFNKQKEEIKTNLRDSTFFCFKKQVVNYVQKILEMKNMMLTDCNDLFCNYLEKYTETVKQLQLADEKEKSEVEIKIKEIEADLKKIKEINNFSNENLIRG